MSATILRFQQSDEPRLVNPDVIGRDDLCFLEVPIEELRFCPHCQHETAFLFNRECAQGLIGTCSECWQPLFRPFTRTTSSEVA